MYDILFVFFLATPRLPAGFFPATLQGDIVGLGSGLGARGGGLPLPVGPLFSLRQIQHCRGPRQIRQLKRQRRRHAPQGRVPEPHQRHLVLMGSLAQFRDRRG